ncbi:hypothetical protein RZS08_33820, partial [Arthrospira platensis SPKY1]|nr:hypothetical protein [Arthrospira platensis SPKY1]
MSLAWGDGDDHRQTIELRDLGEEYRKYPLQFTGGDSTDEAMLEIRVHGAPVCIGTASLMPGDNVRGMRADTLALLKQLNATDRKST